MQATILQAVNASLGRTVGLEEPLMTAGLDSLGTAQSLPAHLFSCNLSLFHCELRLLSVSLTHTSISALEPSSKPGTRPLPEI